MISCVFVALYGISRYVLKRTVSEFDLNLERSPELKEVRYTMHQAIADRDETVVQQCLNDAPALKLWLHPTEDVSALCKAMETKAFRIHGLLILRDCALKDAKELWCYEELSPVERAEMRRQRYHTTEYDNSYIDYLKSRSLSQTLCADFEERLDKMYRELRKDDVIRQILRAVSTAPHLNILFDYGSNNVQRSTGDSSAVVGGTYFLEQRIFIGNSEIEAEIWGTFAHEICHQALYLVYRNQGKPYSVGDKERKSEYLDIINDIEKSKSEANLIIQQAFFGNDVLEQELIVRVPHILAQYGTHYGRAILEREAPKLLKFFTDSVIPDLQTYLQRAVPSLDVHEIEKENVRLQKASKTGKLKVTFETPLTRDALGNKQVLIVTGTELSLLEIMVHGAVQSTALPYLFFEQEQWKDSHLDDVVSAYKCALVLITVNQDEDISGMLEKLHYVFSVTETRLILLAEDSRKECLKKQVSEVFAGNCEDRDDLEATLPRVTEGCKREVFAEARLSLQGKNVGSLSRAMCFDSFSRCIDTASFLSLCDLTCIDLGPDGPEESAKNYYVERVCTRSVEINLEDCTLDDESEAFAILGISHEQIKSLVPDGHKVKTMEELNNYEKFVLLRRHRDYESLKNVDYYQNRVVHLLRLNETGNALLWTKSNGRLSHLRMTGKDSYTLDKLINVNEKVVIVCGEPGIGKSVLASRMCAQMKTQNRKRWVLYVDLPRRMASFKTASLDLGYLADICGVGRDGVEFTLFEKSFQSGKPFEIVVVFDAFDEINERCRKHVLDLALFLTESKVFNIYLFTRTVFKSDVEQHFHTVSYTLTPFSDENKNEFLSKYREQKHATARNDAISRQFRDLYASLTAWNKTILETPLLLRLMAEMENGEITETHVYSSLLDVANISTERTMYNVDVYKMFVEYKHLVYRKEKRKEDIRRTEVQDDENDARSNFYTNHGLLAMKCTFPENILTAILNNNELEQLQPEDRLTKFTKRLKEGFMNGLDNDGTPIFVHKIFAEFFAADFLLQKAEETVDSSFRKLVFSMYSEKTYKGVMHLFDSLASASFPLHSAVINNDASYFAQHVIERKDNLTVDRLGRTPLHVAALYADAALMEKLPIGDDLIKHDRLDLTPFTYAEIFCPWDSYDLHDKTWHSVWSTTNPAARHRLNKLYEGCKQEALRYSGQILGTHETVEGKRHFVIRAVLTAVRHDLRNALDVYLSYVGPKRETSDTSKSQTETVKMSTEGPILETLDELTVKCGRTVLFFAQSKAVTESLLPYCDLGVVDEHGNTLLHVSAREGKLEVTQFHLAHTSVQVTNNMGETPLHLSARRGQVELVKLLLRRCTSVNTPNSAQKTPLDNCAECDHIKTAKLLILRSRMYHEYDVGPTTPLHEAAKCGSLDTVAFLLLHASTRSRNFNGKTSLHEAINLRKLDVANCLVPHSLVSAPDFSGTTPIQVGIKFSRRNVLVTLWPYVRCTEAMCALTISAKFADLNKDLNFQEEILCLKLLLLNSGANTAGHGGQTALHYVAKRRRYRLAEESYIKLLLPHSQLYAQDSAGRTPITLAQEGERNDDIILLYRARVRSHGKESGESEQWRADNESKRELLTRAVEGDVQAVKVRLSHSSVYITNEYEDTPLHLSAEKGHVSVVKLLAPFYSSVDIPNEEQDTPLHLCAHHGHLNVVKSLLLRSRMTATNYRGNTALHIACQEGNVEIVSLLVPHTPAKLRNSAGQTCLLVALPKASRGVLRCLIPHSLTECRSSRGVSPTQLSAQFFVTQSVISLLPYTCDCDAKNLVLSSSTSWERSSRGGTSCLRLMILYSDANATDKTGNTALHVIAKQGKVRDLTAMLLLLPHSNVRAKNGEGMTPTELAEKTGRQSDIVHILQKWTELFSLRDTPEVKS